MHLLLFISDALKTVSFTKCLLSVCPALWFTRHPSPNMHTRPLTPQLVQSTSITATGLCSSTQRTLSFPFYTFYLFFTILFMSVCFVKKLTKVFRFTKTVCQREASSVLPKVFPKDSRLHVETRITGREKQSSSSPHIFLHFQTVVMLLRKNKFFFSLRAKPNLLSRTSPAVWKQHVLNLTLRAAVFNYRQPAATFEISRTVESVFGLFPLVLLSCSLQCELDHQDDCCIYSAASMNS